MKAVEHNHAVPPEELMAYLDGELEPERALVVHAHLANCGSCEALAAELRHTSSDMALWEVAAPVQSLQPPASPAGTASKRRSLFAWLSAAPTFQFAGAAAVVVVGLGLLMAIGGRLPLQRKAASRLNVASSAGIQRQKKESRDPVAQHSRPDSGNQRRTNRLRLRQRSRTLRRGPLALRNSRRLPPRLPRRRSSAP